MEHNTAPKLHREGESILKIQKISPPVFPTQVQKRAGHLFGPQPFLLPQLSSGSTRSCSSYDPCLKDKGRGSRDTGHPTGTFPPLVRGVK